MTLTMITMNKVLGAVCLHYGKDYLLQALLSIKDHVDEIALFYSAKPSHGTATKLPCPDTREELRAIADQVGATWIEINQVTQENQHRIQYERYGAKHGYDQILIVDSDEIFTNVPAMLAAAREKKARRIGVAGSQWVTLWRSFNEYVTDGFAPIRVLNLKEPEGEAVIDQGFIYHMGYCIPDKLMEYKVSCHGHRADFLRNRNWLRDKWHGYEQGKTNYLHPATEAYWQETKPFDKATLPQVLKDHPYYHLDRIQ